MTAYTVTFEPLGRRRQCPETESLLDCSRRLGIGINSVCGGAGTCQACKVRITVGSVSKPTSAELKYFSQQEIRDGWRLACQTYPTGECSIMVPAESMTTPQRIQLEGLEVPVRPEPPVKAYSLKMKAPSLSAPRADADSMLEVLNSQHKVRADRIDIEAMRRLPEQLRSWGWECQAVVRDNEVVAILPKDRPPLGLAFDLGTTKIAGYLVDLTDGKTLATHGVMNPQISYGEDIISRITAIVKAPEKAAEIQQLAVDGINKIIDEMCARASTPAEEIVEAVVVGNTAMHHLFLGLPVKQLALSPFVPTISRAVDVKAGGLGLNMAPGAYVHLLPNIAGFVGADHVAMLLATGVTSADRPVIAIDIGTNTEVSLVYGNRIVATSCASGPAFEGGHISHGMRAATGAIERLRITYDGVQYQTVDNAPPTGICGSGILDALSQLYLAGAIDETGRLQENHSRVRIGNGQREFVLVGEEERERRPAITVTQQDIRELQLAKAAIHTGIQALLDSSGCPGEQIKQVIIAGAFGTYIDIASAITTGMLPPLPPERFRQAGNAAGAGAKLALISLSQRQEAQAIASRVSYIELAGSPKFNKIFVEANYLGQYRIQDGRRESVAP